MSFNTKRAVRLALLMAAAISVTACASRPRPTAPGTTTPQTTYDNTTPAPGPGPVDQSGNGIVAGSVQDFVINVGELVYFDLDSYALRDDARPILDAQAAWLRRYPQVRVRIEGNCDERGTREYNFALGSRRANSVRDYLISRGVSTARIETISFGKERPLDPGSNEEAWARNRNGRTAIIDGAR